jgi:hypothetical protein
MCRSAKQRKQIAYYFGLLLFSQLPVFAVPSQPWNPQKVQEQQKKHLQSLKDYNTMKEPISFADLPVFTAEEDPQTVLNFYKDALGTNSWKICYSNSHTISARHGKGHMCNINVNQSRLPKTKSSFVIDYRQIEQH